MGCYRYHGISCMISFIGSCTVQTHFSSVSFSIIIMLISLVLFSGHDCCETVKVELCASKEGLPILVVAEDRFQFIQDEAYDAAQFLATCAGNQQALNFTRFLDRSRPPSGDLNFLDEKVALAFRHLKLPAEWNVLGADQTLNGEKSSCSCCSVCVSVCVNQKGSRKASVRVSFSIHKGGSSQMPAKVFLLRSYINVCQEPKLSDLAMQ